jgi:AcrR family transcriptional regulator
MQDVTVVERMTQEQRRERTRNLLLDAAEEVFAQRGFEGASLDEIAEVAGYTRGAIYKHFKSKEDLFLEANRRFNERYIHSFLDVINPDTPVGSLDLAMIGKKWRDMAQADILRNPLGAEFELYVLRNPEIRPQVAKQRRKTAEMLAAFMEEQAKVMGIRMRMPALTLARIVLAASDGIANAAIIDDDGGLYEPFLELLMMAWEDVTLSERVREKDQPKDREPRRRADANRSVR